jgi:uncharacterized protein YjcR
MPDSPEKTLRNDTVRKMYCDGFKQFQIAMRLNVSPSRIQQILHGEKRKAKKITANLRG